MITTLGSIISIVVVVLIFLLVRKFGGGKGGAALADAFSKKFCELSGLTQMEDGYSGTYRGYDFTVKAETSTNYADMMLNQSWSVHPKLTVHLRAAGSSFPHTVLCEEHNILFDTYQKINNFLKGNALQLPPEVPSLKGKLPRVNGVYSVDQNFAAKLVNDQELSKLLANWYYLKVVIQGENVILILDHEHAPYKFGERMSFPQYWIEAMNICARIADVAKS
ncbi:MAG: hypothetical protein N2316_11755 [Spirochaetes bacterium]|nr:hypothetical protein [Spirochaetota bacterium]